ncbi:MAG: bifunctional hydroxymethylpyrimidine kinase/phosphomethylpyrimidine kinase, partial [Selenomonadaceae bacterium]
LAGMKCVNTLDEIKEAAARIQQMGAKCVIIKSGSRSEADETLDVLFDGHEYVVNKSKKISGAFNNGAGCTFSAAITAGLAKGLPVAAAAAQAKVFITQALQQSFRLNEYAGALRHWSNRT